MKLRVFSGLPLQSARKATLASLVEDLRPGQEQAQHRPRKRLSLIHQSHRVLAVVPVVVLVVVVVVLVVVAVVLAVVVVVEAVVPVVAQASHIQETPAAVIAKLLYLHLQFHQCMRVDTGGKRISLRGRIWAMVALVL